MCNSEGGGGGGIGSCVDWGKTQIRIQYSGYPTELQNLTLYVETERDLSFLFWKFYSFLIMVRGRVPDTMDLPLICLPVPNPTTATTLLFFFFINKDWRKFKKKVKFDISKKNYVLLLFDNILFNGYKNGEVGSGSGRILNYLVSWIRIRISNSDERIRKKYWLNPEH